MTRYTLLLASMLIALACSPEPTEFCSHDGQCPSTKICEQGSCVTGSRSHGDGDQGEGDNDHPVGDGITTDDDMPIGDTDGLDLEGPSITITSPCAYCLVAGVITIEAEISDPSAVDTDSVKARIADDYEVPLTLEEGIYSAEFPTQNLVGMLYPTIEVVARDKLGNENTVGYEFALDNAPPVVALESPNIVMKRRIADGTSQCSWPFNPLGLSAITDHEVIKPGEKFGLLFFARARIEDDGNGGGEGVHIPIGGIDDETTKLYILSSKGLGAGHRLVTRVSDHDSACQINPAVEPDPADPLPEQAVVQRLVPIAVSGIPDFTPGASVPNCPDGTETSIPEPRCGNGDDLDPTYWIPASCGSPAIYAVNEYSSTSPILCAGGPFDVRNLPDGYACLAAVASDQLGNTATSKPLAICINASGTADCDPFDPAEVNCSDGCIATSFGSGAIRRMP